MSPTVELDSSLAGIDLANDQYRIHRIPAFSDNYLWLVDNGYSAFAIDPGDAQPIIDILKQYSLSLESILTTHHHPDHIGGVNELVALTGATVIGPQSAHIPQVNQIVRQDDTVAVLDFNFSVIEVPGHTLDHIAYFSDANNPLSKPLLFSGDTLFAGGCGRVFEGSFSQMRESLSKLKQLPSETRIYCAHEYTQANLCFAEAVEPNNAALQTRIADVNHRRSSHQTTVPSHLADELSTNPFLRYNIDSVIAVAEQRLGRQPANDDEVFGSIREWKDQF